MEYKIRKRILKDLPSILRILRDGFPHWYRRIPYLVFRTLVVEDKVGILGFVTIVKHKDAGEIGLIAVSEESRGKGLGSALLAAALEDLVACHINRCTAKVRFDNISAQHLFHKLGFSNLFVKRRRLLGDVYLVEKILSSTEA